MDYLTLLHEEFQQRIWQRLHQGPPHLVTAARPWHQVNLLTGGHLLTTGG